MNEVQEILATVQVTNERQVITSTVTGVDEVQTVRLSSATVLPEIQTLTTSTSDVDEVQVVSMTADNVDEIQTFVTSASHIYAVQRVTITGTKENEVQRLLLTEPRVKQVLAISATNTIDDISAVQTITITEPRNTQTLTVSSGSAMSTTQAKHRIIVNANPTSGLSGSFTLTLDNTATSDGGLLDSRTFATTTMGVDVSLRGANAATAVKKECAHDAAAALRVRQRHLGLPP